MNEDTFDPGEHVCSFCGRHPRDEDDFDVWAPLSGDGLVCGDADCRRDLARKLG